MSVATAAKIQLLSEAPDFKEAVFKEIGDLSRDIALVDRLLVAIYFRPKMTRGGIRRPDTNVEEDAYQSKVGLILMIGSAAFHVDRYNPEDIIQVGDYVLYRASDGFPASRNGVPCRILRDEQIMMKVSNPEEWF